MRLLISFFVLGLVLSSCEMSSHDPYVRRVEAFRYTRDSFFKWDHVHSPIPETESKTFVKLKYFEVDTNYRLTGTFIPCKREIVSMPYSGGRVFDFVKYGTINFKLKGKPYHLTAYMGVEQASIAKEELELFIPFSDVTSHELTYHSGRFMDVKWKLNSPTVELDFNYCYNPDCAYNMASSCPIPPGENYLPVAIEAGELNP